MKHKIAVIPGDGIGNEVVPEGMRVLEAAGRLFGFARAEAVRLELRALRQDRPDDARGRARAAPRRSRRSSSARWAARRARPRLAVGPAHPHPPGLPAVRQPAPGAPAQGRALAARGPDARRHRHADRAGEQRGRVLGDRRPALPRAPTRSWRSSRRSSRGRAATASCATPSSWRASGRAST